MIRSLVLAFSLAAALLLGGCGMFGCGGYSTNGGGFGGCAGSLRF